MKILNIITWPVRVLRDIRISHMLRRATINDIDKVSGTDFEQIVAYILRKMHFKVSTTPASGDYGADILATKWHTKYAIQCKLYFGHGVGNKAINEVHAARNYYCCDEAIVITNSHFTTAAHNIAATTHTILIDRTILQKLLTLPYKNGAQLVANLTLKNKQM